MTRLIRGNRCGEARGFCPPVLDFTSRLAPLIRKNNDCTKTD